MTTMIQGRREEGGRDFFRVALAIYIVAAFFTKYVDYAFGMRILPVPPSFWLYLLYGMVFVLAAFNGRALTSMVRNPLFWWGLFYLSITFMWIFWNSTSLGVQDLFKDRLQAVAFLFSCLLVLSSEKAIQAARWTLVAAVLLAIGLNLWDAIEPMKFTSILGRSAGFYGNPNQSGIALVIGMVMSITILPSKVRPIYYLLVMGGVAMTFSRSAFLAGLLAAVGLMLRHHFQARQLAGLVTILLVAATAYVSSFGSIDHFLRDSAFLNDNTRTRAQFSTDDDSSRTRKALAKAAWDKFGDSPIWGSGLGASVVWGHRSSSHNIYLNLMVDHGLVGMLVVPFLLWAVCRRNKDAFILGLIVFWWGFYSHNLLVERYMLFCIALQAVLTQRALEQTEEEPLYILVEDRVVTERMVEA